MNFTAGKTRKDTVYLWDFGNGETFSGANPKALKYSIGSYRILLRALDIVTGQTHEEHFTVIVQKLLSAKKPKKPKKEKVVVKTEKPLTIQ